MKPDEASTSSNFFENPPQIDTSTILVSTQTNPNFSSPIASTSNLNVKKIKNNALNVKRDVKRIPIKGKFGRKRNFEITGLNSLHNHTMSKLNSDRLQPAPDCIEEKLACSITNMTQEEHEFPSKNALNLLFGLFSFHEQFLRATDYLQNSAQNQNPDLNNRINELKNHIKSLNENNIKIHKTNMKSLGIEPNAQNGLSSQIINGVELNTNSISACGLAMEDIASCLSSVNYSNNMQLNTNTPSQSSTLPAQKALAQAKHAVIPDSKNETILENLLIRKALTKKLNPMDYKINSDRLHRYIKAKESKLFENEPIGYEIGASGKVFIALSNRSFFLRNRGYFKKN